MGRIAIFTDDPGWHGKQLRLAFANRGYTSEYVSLTECKLQLDSEGLPVLIPGFGPQQISFSHRLMSAIEGNSDIEVKALFFCF